VVKLLKDYILIGENIGLTLDALVHPRCTSSTKIALQYFANAENIVRVPDFVQKQRNFVF
jgi:hypothetical protein